MLTADGCRLRQQRLANALEAAHLPVALITSPCDIHYLTGLDVTDSIDRSPSLLLLGPGRPTILVASFADRDATVDQREVYSSHTTPAGHRQLAAWIAANAGGLIRGVGRIGLQTESATKLVADALLSAAGVGDSMAIDELLQRLQMRKEPDELACLRVCGNAVTAAMAQAADSLARGLAYGSLVAACQHAAVLAAGSPCTLEVLVSPSPSEWANRSTTPCVVDVRVRADGYWGRAARTWSLAETAAKPLQSAFDHLAEIFFDIPTLIRPDACCPECWKELDARVREHPPFGAVGLSSRAGHGIGVRFHEPPLISPEIDAVFEIGQVLTLTLALAAPEVGGEIRLANTYAVTETGGETLTETPVELTPASSGR